MQCLEDHGVSGFGGFEWRDGDDAVLHYGIEEARFGSEALALVAFDDWAFLVLNVGDVVEHPAE